MSNGPKDAETTAELQAHSRPHSGTMGLSRNCSGSSGGGGGGGGSGGDSGRLHGLMCCSYDAQFLWPCFCSLCDSCRKQPLSVDSESCLSTRRWDGLSLIWQVFHMKPPRRSLARLQVKHPVHPAALRWGAWCSEEPQQGPYNQPEPVGGTELWGDVYQTSDGPWLISF